MRCNHAIKLTVNGRLETYCYRKLGHKGHHAFRIGDYEVQQQNLQEEKDATQKQVPSVSPVQLNIYGEAEEPTKKATDFP